MNNDLVKTLEEIQNTGSSKVTGKITRQRLRAEQRKLVKEGRSGAKTLAMSRKIPGGAAKIR